MPAIYIIVDVRRCDDANKYPWSHIMSQLLEMNLEFGHCLNMHTVIIGIETSKRGKVLIIEVLVTS